MILKAFITLLALSFVSTTYAQETIVDPEKIEIYTLIQMYARARATKDSLRLNAILASETDQLVSSGNWRNTREEALQGMLRSSANNPGKRTLRVHKYRLLNPGSAIVDCRYQIKNPNGTERNMWSSFLLVKEDKKWKITAIRNMLPARAQ